MPQTSYNCWIKEVFIFIYFIETLCTHVGHTEKSSKEFGVPGEANYLEEEPGITLSQSFSKDQTFSFQHEEETITVLGSPIKFDPPNLTFKKQPTGVPFLAKVRIFNINSHSSIQMLSISGNTLHFHCSFFTDKVIPPGGNTTFEVVFLGREPGLVENTLYIHTSAGSFRYNVEGESTPNPYRLRPLVGVKMPVNSSFSPVIQLYNPHPTTIQVLEMHSSGGDLHLELPTEAEAEQGETNNQVWEIPPYHTKGVMRANFRGRVESNNTAYIRIKTNSTDGEYLYVPLEIEVSSAPGLYSTQEVINFGRLPSEGGTVSVPISLLNSGSRSVTLTNIVSNPVSDALSVEFASSMKVLPSTTKATVVATATYNPSLDLGKEGLHTGKLIIKSKNSAHRLVIPWSVEVLAGSLAFNQSVSKFLVNDHTEADDPSQMPFLSTTRSLSVTNRFSVPLAVHSALLAPEAADVFTISKFKPKVIKPGDTISLAKVGLKTEYRSGTGINLDTHLTLHTNLTSVQVPLVLFHGNLQPFLPSSPSETVLDFGTVGMNEKKEMYFALINKGPVKVVLRGWGGNITGSLIELMGVAPGAENEILSRTNFSSLARKLYVPPHHYVVYRIGLMTGKVEGEMWASVFVSTEFQDLIVPFRFLVAKGSLTTVPDEINLGTNFPGRSSKVSLFVHSTFKHKMKVKSISVVGNDKRFSFSIPEDATILPGETSLIGDVVFDPGAVCRTEENCYTGFNVEDKFGHPWYLGLALPLNLGEMDLSTVLILWSRMRMATVTNSQFNMTLRLDTNEVKGFHFNAKAALSWPILCLDALRKFPLTQLGNTTREEILLINPSQLPVLVHIVPLSSYPNPSEILANLPNRIKYEDEVEIFPELNDSDTFQIESVVDAYDPFAPVATFGDDFSERFDIGVAPNTYPVVLKPNQAVKISVLFAPKVPSVPLSSVLFIRNNLTGLQTVDLVGRGAIGDLKFGNKRTGSSIHAFDVTEKHLKDCDKELSARNQPGLTVKRHFTARNTGEVPIWVTGFVIDGYSCEGYGFKVLDCDPFELAANASKRINIAFTPDFTLSKITRTLTLKTSLGGQGKGDIQYTLTATVPSHLLSVCSKSLPRPAWEFYLYIMVVTLTVLTLLCALVASVVESDRILRYCYIMSTHASTNTHGTSLGSVPENARLLDLREVARQTMQECKDRERSQSPSMNLRKRKLPKLPASPNLGGGTSSTESPPVTPFPTNAATQILDDLNNTHPTSTKEILSQPPSDSTVGIIPQGIISLLLDFLWPTARQDGPRSDQNQSSPRIPENKDVQQNRLSMMLDADRNVAATTSTTSSKASTPQAKKKHLEATASCPANLTPISGGNRKKKGNKIQHGGTDSHQTWSEGSPYLASDMMYIKPKPKISAQSSVNDEFETWSTSTDNSNSDDFLVDQHSGQSGGQTKKQEVINLGSDSTPSLESGKKKKKKNKVEDQVLNGPNKETRQNSASKPKKKEKVAETKSDKHESPAKEHPRHVSGGENNKMTPCPSPASHLTSSRSSTPATPPPKKQEAKVRGVPKDGGGTGRGSPAGSGAVELRRQQSLPTYDKPPRLQHQNHQNNSNVRMESYSSFSEATSQQTDSVSQTFPASTAQQPTRSEPPRAIIFPEPKREAPVNQFGAIGCKVPIQQPQQQSQGLNNWSKVGGGNKNEVVSTHQTSELGLTPASLTNSLPGLISGANSGLTIMQELQAERRIREQEFRRNNPGGNSSQWPGFGPESSVNGIMRRSDYFESLWDSHAAPTSNGSNNSGPIAQGPSASMVGRWGTIGQNVWPSTQVQPGYAGSSNMQMNVAGHHGHHAAGQNGMVVGYNGGNVPANVVGTTTPGGVSGMQVHQQMNGGSGVMYAPASGKANKQQAQQQDMDPYSISSIWSKGNNNSGTGVSVAAVGGNMSQQRPDVGVQQQQQQQPPVTINNTWSAALFNKNKDL